MTPRASLTLLTLLAGCLAVPAVGQNLRRAVTDADLVVVAKGVGVQPLGNDYFVRRFEVSETLKGDAVDQFSILERKQVSDQPTPQVGEPRIYCLRPERKADLPARYAPYFRMTGHAGENPPISDDDEARSRLELIEILIASEQGQGPSKTANQLLRLGLRGAGDARREAIEVLREREVLRDSMSVIEREGLTMRAVAETDDIPLKVSLASLCAESGTANIVETLCMSVDQVDDPRFLRAVGRIAKVRHGEDATEVMVPMLARANEARRERLLFVLGSTHTQSALAELLDLYKKAPDDPALRAALREDGSTAARQALQRDQGQDQR